MAWDELQDLLLAQLVHRHGTSGMLQVAERLSTHPLLRPLRGQGGGEKRKAAGAAVTSDECAARYKEILDQNGLPYEESASTGPGSRPARSLLQLCDKLYAQYRASLIKAIRAYEDEFREAVKALDPSTQPDQAMADAASEIPQEQEQKEPVQAAQEGGTSGVEPEVHGELGPADADGSAAGEPDVAAAEPAEPGNEGAERAAEQEETEQLGDAVAGPDVQEHGSEKLDNEAVEEEPAQEGEARTELKAGATDTGSNAVSPDPKPDEAHEAREETPRLNSEEHKKFMAMVLPVLQNVSQHRYGNVFAHPIHKRDAPDYDQMVRVPQDFRTLRNQIKQGDISTTAEFYREVLRVFANAIMYNHEGSALSEWAYECFSSTEQSLNMYRGLEWLSTGVDHDSGLVKTKRKKI